ncbi:MAG: amidase family protein, partial [Terracidiphilus sp.]
MNEVVLASATRQLELLRSGEISVVELAEAHLEQIARLNLQLNVFADFDAERVHERARKHDEWRGTRSRRPLFGLPVTVKSSIATRGFKCEIGSLLHQGEVAREDAVVVARLRAAGALILGTTNCPEFLMAYETANL